MSYEGNIEMNILFLSLIDFETIEERGIYTDLLREFAKRGDNLYIISPIEKRKQKETYFIENDNIKILKPKIGNMQKTNIIEKGISTITVEGKVLRAIKKYYKDVKFDLILYATPPITFEKVIKYIKKRDKAVSYLMLKDIFPQNAVDMGMLSKKGIKGVIYKFFRRKEKKLYCISDIIGCTSQASIDYVIANNIELRDSRVVLCPNCIEVIDENISEIEKVQIREKYSIPSDKKLFVYGGNLGKPQGIDFLLQCLESQKDNNEIFFLIVGSGTEYKKIENYIEKSKQKNVKLLSQLPKDDYDKMIYCCDIGLIFLDYRFTIPNFPSRLLAYMQAKLPVLAVTDESTDIGKVIVSGEFGWSCTSDNIDEWNNVIQNILESDYSEKKKNAFMYLTKHYAVSEQYDMIMNEITR